MLPSEEQQAWINAELRTLIERCGLRRFLSGRVFLPTPTDFPRPWNADLRGANRVALGRPLPVRSLESFGHFSCRDGRRQPRGNR